MTHRIPLLLAAALVLAPAALSAQPRARIADELVSLARRDQDRLRACYEAHRAEGRSAWRGLRTATLVINADGTIGASGLLPGPQAPSIEACVRPIVNAWRVTAPGQGTVLRWTRTELRRAAARVHP